MSCQLVVSLVVPRASSNITPSGSCATKGSFAVEVGGPNPAVARLSRSMPSSVGTGNACELVQPPVAGQVRPPVPPARYIARVGALAQLVTPWARRLGATGSVFWQLVPERPSVWQLRPVP